MLMHHLLLHAQAAHQLVDVRLDVVAHRVIHGSLIDVHVVMALLI